MGDDSVDVPLWDDVNGLMFNDVTELVRELGVSSELASDLSVWAHEWQRHARQPDQDASAARLVQRLTDELGSRFVFVFRR